MRRMIPIWGARAAFCMRNPARAYPTRLCAGALHAAGPSSARAARFISRQLLGELACRSRDSLRVAARLDGLHHRRKGVFVAEHIRCTLVHAGDRRNHARRHRELTTILKLGGQTVRIGDGHVGGDAARCCLHTPGSFASGIERIFSASAAISLRWFAVRVKSPSA